jgi:hypothetical protein
MVSEAGWAIGATKSFVVDGQTKTATLIGIDHDTTGTTTWMITTTGGIGYHAMNSFWTNDGGWQDSEMRTWLNGYIYESMTDTKAYIKEVSKDTNNIGYNGNSVSATNDKVFLLSQKEAGVSNNWNWSDYPGMNALNNEGTTYEWLESNTVGDWFWLRSPSSYSSDSFFYYYYGDLGCNSADIAYTVCPAFVIG